MAPFTKTIEIFSLAMLSGNTPPNNCKDSINRRAVIQSSVLTAGTVLTQRGNPVCAATTSVPPIATLSDGTTFPLISFVRRYSV